MGDTNLVRPKNFGKIELLGTTFQPSKRKIPLKLLYLKNKWKRKRKKLKNGVADGKNSEIT